MNHHGGFAALAPAMDRNHPGLWRDALNGVWLITLIGCQERPPSLEFKLSFFSTLFLKRRNEFLSCGVPPSLVNFRESLSIRKWRFTPRRGFEYQLVSHFSRGVDVPQ